MSILLGNLSIKDMEKRLGVEFPKELVEYMEERHQAPASNIAEGKWHCFEIPFTLACGDSDVAKTIYEFLLPLAGDFKAAMQIAVQS
jgi:hypothetical protein